MLWCVPSRLPMRLLTRWRLNVSYPLSIYQSACISVLPILFTHHHFYFRSRLCALPNSSDGRSLCVRFSMSKSSLHSFIPDTADRSISLIRSQGWLGTTRCPNLSTPSKIRMLVVQTSLICVPWPYRSAGWDWIPGSSCIACCGK